MTLSANIVAALALLVAASALLCIRALYARMASWRGAAIEEAKGIRREIEHRMTAARTELDALIEAANTGGMEAVKGLIHEQLQAAQASAGQRIADALEASRAEIEERVRVVVRDQFEREREAASDLVEQAEDTIARLNTAHGKAIRAVRTARTRLADLEDDDDDDDDDGPFGGMDESWLRLASTLPPEVRQGILEHAPPEHRAQVNLMFAAADARAQHGQAPQAPERQQAPPSGLII